MAKKLNPLFNIIATGMIDSLNQTAKMNKASGDIFNRSSNYLSRKVFPSKMRLTHFTPTSLLAYKRIKYTSIIMHI